MIISEIFKGIFGDGGLAGEVVDVLKSTGVIKDPEMELRVRTAIQEAELKKGQQEIDLEKIYIDDRKSARDMNIVSLQQDDKFVKRFIYYYAAITTVATFSYIFFVTFWDIPKENLNTANTILGFMLGTFLATLINFFFGSSAGSMAKSKVLDILSKEK